MMTATPPAPETSEVRRTARSRARAIAPGLALSVGAGLLSVAVGRLVPVASPLLVAILLGVLLAASGRTTTATEPGVAVAGRTLLRAGVVLLGLQLSLREIAGLGWGVVALVVAIVTLGITGALWLGRRLGLSWTQRLLIACGFSICGAAAVAAVDGTVEAEEEEVATAVALVVVFGTAMIGVVPLLAHLLGLGDRTAGVWAGASIHEVAQVVAAGGVIGGGALGVAVVVKLARVLLLAPVLAWAGWQRRRLLASSTASCGPRGDLPPLVPGFVIGFVGLVAVHTWVPLPQGVLEAARLLETLLLASAMFALGCGVRVERLRRGGSGPVLLAAGATAWVGALGLVGSVLVG